MFQIQDLYIYSSFFYFVKLIALKQETFTNKTKMPFMATDIYFIQATQYPLLLQLYIIMRSKNNYTS